MILVWKIRWQMLEYRISTLYTIDNWCISSLCIFFRGVTFKRPAHLGREQVNARNAAITLVADVRWLYSDDLRIYIRETKCSQETEMVLHLYVSGTKKTKNKHKLQPETWKLRGYNFGISPCLSVYLQNRLTKSSTEKRILPSESFNMMKQSKHAHECQKTILWKEVQAYLYFCIIFL